MMEESTHIPGELVNEFIRFLLNRGDQPIDTACEAWMPKHLLGRGPIYPLAFQTYTICALVELYELVSKAGVAATAALIFEKDPSLTRQQCAELAKGMVKEAGEHLRLADIDAGPMQ